MTIRALRSCSRSCGQRRCRPRRGQAKSQGEQSSTLCCRLRVCSAEWVCLLYISFQDVKPDTSTAGCHVLALDLVRSWSFERPSTVVREAPEASPVLSHERSGPPSPTTTRRAFGMEPALRRRSSIMIDMDIPSLPPTRAASPERKEKTTPSKPVPIIEDTIKEEGDLFARKAGLGSLMKSAKQDVKVPEFDMSAFF